MEILQLLDIQPKGQEKNLAADQRSESGQEESFAAVLQKQQIEPKQEAPKQIVNEASSGQAAKTEKSVENIQDKTDHENPQNAKDQLAEKQSDSKNGMREPEKSGQEKNLAADQREGKETALQLQNMGKNNFEQLSQSLLLQDATSQASSQKGLAQLSSLPQQSIMQEPSAFIQNQTKIQDQLKELAQQGRATQISAVANRNTQKDPNLELKQKLTEVLDHKNIDSNTKIDLKIVTESLSGQKSPLSPMLFGQMHSNSVLLQDTAPLLNNTTPLGLGQNMTINQGQVTPQGQVAPFFGKTHENIREQIRVQMTKSLDQGMKNIEIKLHPASLGKIDVKLDFQSDGTVKTVFSVEKPETLEMLQRDNKHIESVLKEAGLKTNMENLHFESQQKNKNLAHSEASHREVSALSDEEDSKVDKIIYAKNQYELNDLIEKGIREGKVDLYI